MQVVNYWTVLYKCDFCGLEMHNMDGMKRHEDECKHYFSYNPEKKGCLSCNYACRGYNGMDIVDKCRKGLSRLLHDRIDCNKYEQRKEDGEK